MSYAFPADIGSIGQSLVVIPLTAGKQVLGWGVPVGPPGPRGPQGSQGLTGTQGGQGSQGITGVDGGGGLPGLRGPTGPPGPPGPGAGAAESGLMQTFNNTGLFTFTTDAGTAWTPVLSLSEVHALPLGAVVNIQARVDFYTPQAGSGTTATLFQILLMNGGTVIQTGPAFQQVQPNFGFLNGAGFAFTTVFTIPEAGQIYSYALQAANAGSYTVILNNILMSSQATA